MSIPRIAVLSVALAIAAGAASAHEEGMTVGEAMRSGLMSDAAAYQFVFGSGYTVQEAQDVTINAIAFEKWGDA